MQGPSTVPTSEITEAMRLFSQSEEAMIAARFFAHHRDRLTFIEGQHVLQRHSHAR
jgi:hypothetical protein